jgi:hypothetical protein
LFPQERRWVVEAVAVAAVLAPEPEQARVFPPAGRQHCFRLKGLQRGQLPGLQQARVGLTAAPRPVDLLEFRQVAGLPAPDQKISCNRRRLIPRKGRRLPEEADYGSCPWTFLVLRICTKTPVEDYHSTIALIKDRTG